MCLMPGTASLQRFALEGGNRPEPRFRVPAISSGKTSLQAHFGKQGRQRLKTLYTVFLVRHMTAQQGAQHAPALSVPPR